MLEKMPSLSLKDFIIYFIPGALICYFSWDLYNFSNRTGEEIMRYNAVLVFIGIAISFLTGFLTSQLQIIIYSWLIREKLRSLRKISSMKEPHQIKKALLLEIQKRFEIKADDSVDLLNDSEIVYLCEQYVLLNTTDKGQSYVDRSSHLASFAYASILPILLGLADLFNHFNFKLCLILWCLTVSLMILSLLLYQVVRNFKSGWSTTIFRQFLVLSQSHK